VSVELGVTLLIGLVLVAERVSVWRACRTPIGRVNHEMAQARARRRR
jgi:hypothetical protein